MIKQTQTKLNAQYASDGLINGSLRQFSFLQQFSTILVKKTAHHLHIHAGVKGSLCRVGIAGSHSMILEFSYRCIVTDHKAVKLPFTAQNLCQRERIGGRERKTTRLTP